MVIKAHGWLVDIIPVRSYPEMGRYSAVILGGNVRFGQVHADMSAFIHNYTAELSHIPAAYFVINNTLAKPTSARIQILKKSLRSTLHPGGQGETGQYCCVYPPDKYPGIPTSAK